MATGQVRRREGLSGPHGPDPRPTPRTPVLDLASLQPFLLHALRSRSAGTDHHSPGGGRLKRSAPPFGPMHQMWVQGRNDSVAELGKRKRWLSAVPCRQNVNRARCGQDLHIVRRSTAIGSNVHSARNIRDDRLTLLFLFSLLPGVVVIFVVVVGARLTLEPEATEHVAQRWNG